MRSSRHLAAGVVGALALAGCAGAAADVPSDLQTREVRVSSLFATRPGVAVTYDEALVPSGARGAVSSTSGDGTTTVQLAVRGLQPGRAYGAHAHTGPCGRTGDEAGPHFQYVVDPVQPGVDPEYANAENEIWLALTTDAAGAGTAETSVSWAFPGDRRPHSVVVHAMPTATEAGQAGTAGARAACIGVDF